MTPTSCMTEAATKPGLLELALTFNKISLASFGGGLSAWARRVIVEEKKWLDDEEFLSALTLSRVLPGANQTNFALCWQPLPRLRGPSPRFLGLLPFRS